jgi:hypothetical protein
MIKKDFEEDKKTFTELKKNTIYKAVYNVNCTDCDGDNLLDSKNCTHVFDAMRMQNCKYYLAGDAGINCMDIFMS